MGTAGAATSREAKTVTVSTVKTDKFGKILVSGKTLYTLKPSKTACTAQCVTDLARARAAYGCDEGDGRDRCERLEARNGELAPAESSR